MSKRFWFDLLERSVWTFAQAFAATWLVTQSVDRTTLEVAALAGLIAVAKCVMASQFGARETAATLPESLT